MSRVFNLEWIISKGLVFLSHFKVLRLLVFTFTGSRKSGMSYSVNAMVLYAAIIANMIMQITYQNRDRIVAYLQKWRKKNKGVMILLI